MNTTTKKATEIQVGDKVVERDGCFFVVEKVDRQGRYIMLGLANVNGYMGMGAKHNHILSGRAKVRVMV